jgi:hypothetical protein
MYGGGVGSWNRSKKYFPVVSPVGISTVQAVMVPVLEDTHVPRGS